MITTYMIFPLLNSTFERKVGVGPTYLKKYCHNLTLFTYRYNHDQEFVG